MFKNNLYNLFFISLILNFNDFPTRAYRTFTEHGVEIIMAIENETVDMECKTDMPITYCGFIHNETRYSFAGKATKVGKCSITIKAAKNQTGVWRCHIGSYPIGEEIMKIIHLRSVKEIAAKENNIKATLRKSATLYCMTIRGLIPLSYCRFEPPNKLPFGIDSRVTDKNPLLDRYYFPADKSLDRGDCAVTIQKVSFEDVGTWTCGAGFNDGTEQTDVINLRVQGLSKLPVAAVLALILGSIGLITFVITLGVYVYIKQNYIGVHRQAESHELQQMHSRRSSRQTTPDPRVIPSIVIQSPSDSGMSTMFMPEPERDYSY